MDTVRSRLFKPNGIINPSLALSLLCFQPLEDMMESEECAFPAAAGQFLRGHAQRHVDGSQKNCEAKIRTLTKQPSLQNITIANLDASPRGFFESFAVFSAFLSPFQRLGPCPSATFQCNGTFLNRLMIRKINKEQGYLLR